MRSQLRVVSHMKKHWSIAIISGLIASTGAIGAYFSGFWIPNFPHKGDYPIRGIDVSRHQGVIQWSLIPREDVQFAYIKATEGSDYRDTRFAENWKGSATTGLRRGAYHFFTFKTPGLQQAANFTAIVPREDDALPPAIDLEFGGNSSARPPVQEFQHELKSFIAAVRSFYGREPVLYTASDFKNHYLAGFPISRLWIRSVVTTPRLPNGENWLFWQFSEKIRVPGITGFVDHNVFKGDQKQFTSLFDERG
jgi:lysozyme